MRLRKIRREKAEIIHRMQTGGRKTKRPQRTKSEHHQRILDDYYGRKEVKVNGVVVKEMVPPWQSPQHFYTRYRMGDVLFSRLLTRFRMMRPDTKCFDRSPTRWEKKVPHHCRN